MYVIAINVVRAAVVEAVKIAAVSGAITATVNFASRRFSKEHNTPENETAYVFNDFREGAINIFKENPVATAAFVVAAGASVVSPPVAAVATLVGVGAVAWSIGKTVIDIAKTANPTTPEQEAFEQEVRKASEAFTGEYARRDREEALRDSFKIDVNLDAEVFKKGTAKDARAYGYSWFDENFSGKGISFSAVKKAANEALIKAGISGSKKVLFFQGMEDAAAS